VKITARVVAGRGERPELAEAATAASGRPGVGIVEKFALIEKLADCIGAAVAPSRADDATLDHEPVE
jgi:electron transfer flavoprotein alpha subunit